MYSTAIWEAWLKQENQNYYQEKNGKKIYKKKGYLHLDPRFWFLDNNAEIEEILKNNLQVTDSKTKLKKYYSFSPFLKIITKTPRYRYQFEEGHYDLETKKRPICFAAHKDSLILGFYSFALTKVYEEYIKKHSFDDVVLAYRSDLGKCNIQFAKDTFDHIKKRKECSVISLDIKGFFDHIDHALLLEKWQRVINGRLPEDQFRLYKILTQYSYISRASLLKKYKGPKKRDDKLPATLMDIIPGKGILEKFKQLKTDQLIVSNTSPNEKTNRLCGIPQGSPISALLSNIFLIDFDSDLKKKSYDEGFVYRRYCDDILVICDTSQANELMDFIIKKISEEYYLTIQPAKVDLIDFFKNSKGKIRGFRRPRKTRKKIGEKDIVTIKDSPARINYLNEEKYYRPVQYLGFEFNGKDILIRSSSLSRYFWKLHYRLQRTIIMAYSPNSKSDQIFLQQIYERYTHLGQRNFLTYAYNAAKEFYENADGKLMYGLNSYAIKRQVRNHWTILRHKLTKKNIRWYSHKLTGNKEVSPKYFK